jgi:hypothetical protein
MVLGSTLVEIGTAHQLAAPTSKGREAKLTKRNPKISTTLPFHTSPSSMAERRLKARNTSMTKPPKLG